MATNKPGIRHASLLLVAGLCLSIHSAQGAQLLENGDFESGELNGWEDHSSGEAQIQIIRRNTCFSSADTRDLQIRGHYAALLRAESKAQTSAILRSAEFIAGDGFAFIALNESQQSTSNQSQILFQVDVLDAQTERVLVSQLFSPAEILLKQGCPGQGTTGKFSSHYFDTRAYAGKALKIQFKQSLSHGSDRLFTLIDQLVLFQNGEQANFFSRPHAQAGFAIGPEGVPYLTSKGSFDPDHHPSPLSFSWWLKGQQYHSAQPCLSAIQQGNHQAVLYINDGHHAISDTLQFFLGSELIEPTARRKLHCDMPETR